MRSTVTVCTIASTIIVYHNEQTKNMNEPVLARADCEPLETLDDGSNPADSSLTTSRQSITSTTDDDDRSASLHSTAN